MPPVITDLKYIDSHRTYSSIWRRWLAPTVLVVVCALSGWVGQAEEPKPDMTHGSEENPELEETRQEPEGYTGSPPSSAEPTENALPPSVGDRERREDRRLEIEETKLRYSLWTSAAVAIGLLLAFWRSLILSRQAQTAALQAEVAAQGQATERFVKAIEQLEKGKPGGPDALTVRLGGIYALEKLAQEQPDRYHWTVIEVLCSFVRENASIESKSVDPATSPQVDTGKDVQTGAVNPKCIAMDIQAAASVIGRRKGKHRSRQLRKVEELERGKRLDLRHAAFPKADLGYQVPSGATRSTGFIGWVVYEAVCYYVVNRRGGNLKEANYAHAMLTNAHVRGADLSNARLSGADLNNADLSQANLFEANLSRASLCGTNLTGANLRGAVLRGANLRGANLDGAHFGKFPSRATVLNGSDLRGCSGLTQEQIEETLGDPYTEIPEGLKRPWIWRQRQSSPRPDSIEEGDRQREAG